MDQPGYCQTHIKQVRKWADKDRGNAADRGYNAEWQRQSRLFLRARPLCECNDCKTGKARQQKATVVDHIIPHRLWEAKQSGDPEQINAALALFWNQANWMPMSKAHHDKKTATQDGAFGRAAQGRGR